MFFRHNTKVTLYAIWKINTYTVTYNYSENGGTSATKTSTSVNYGSQIDLTPTASKSGYTFVGWNTSKTATTKLTSLTMGTSNVTLYAIYSKTVTATCYYYTGSAQTSKKVSGTMYNTSTTVSVNLGTSSVSGYTFRGWSTTNSGSATIAVASNGSVSLSANATYYGLYQYTVTGTYYYYNGSSYTNSKANATAYMNSSGTKVGGKPTAPTVSNPSGWTARGWSTSSSATGTVAIPGVITTNTTYYYSWSKTITLTYNANGGTNIPGNQSTTRYLNYAGTQSGGSLTISSTKPKRTDYIFMGWNTNSTGTGTNYSAGTTVTSSLTLYTKWLQIPKVKYQVHVQDIGWQGWKYDGETAGTTGQNKRVEAIQVDYYYEHSDWQSECIIAYQVLGFNGLYYPSLDTVAGNEHSSVNGEICGTTGQNLALKAIWSAIFDYNSNNVYGESKYFDIWYRVHVSNRGWLPWTKMGNAAGTTSANQVEAIEMVITEKGAPNPDGNTNYTVDWQ